MTSTSTLTSLLPTKRGAVMDLVEQAGIDVSSWLTKKNGNPVKKPRANPKFCYEWSFGGGDEPIALCIWHKDLQALDDQIFCHDNLQTFAIQLEAREKDSTSSNKVKSRARSQAQRARKFDQQIAKAYKLNLPIRSIILRGTESNTNRPGDNTSKVDFRLLDPVPWHIETYSSNGEFRLVRGEPPDTEPKFFDQFDVVEPAIRVETSGSTFRRSQEVRSSVLLRSGGICECCGNPGFEMPNGAIYLETHHVIPLSEGGADHVSNVVAICANDHRKAHHSLQKSEIRTQLLEKLAALRVGFIRSKI